jgi:hypothetical protein|tara:strand:+ start:471 stop:782 length:312 start_codon:yes stop_codon:yes gene_type:complete
MNKKFIIIAVAVPLVLISGAASSVYFSSECKYNPFTGAFVVDGKEYAHGTMKDAWACALEGGLPQSVISRLGKYGDRDTQLEAEKIINKDREIRQKGEGNNDG